MNLDAARVVALQGLRGIAQLLFQEFKPRFAPVQKLEAFEPDERGGAQVSLEKLERVVLTHPGTLRHPSNGDYRGDSVWVSQLRGREGVFGIGTVEKEGSGPPWLVERPRPHVQRQGRSRFTWYALSADDRDYRTLPVE